MADLATLQTRLAEAEQALHDVSIGKKAIDIWDDGSRVRYTAAETSKLEAYIAKLNTQIAKAQGKSTGGRRIGVAWN